MKKFKVGLIGCGVISDIYLKTCQQFDVLDIVACASLDIEESRTKARQYNIPKACHPDDIILDPNIDCVLNLTIPSSHAEISLKALAADKHVYSEKPLATNSEDGKKILSLAKTKGLYVGNAPDTFLGGRWQTCRKIIEENLVGKPIGFSAFACTHGVEKYHPNPTFYYKTGGGPLFDLGPYYLTTLIALLGPVKRVCGFAKKTFDKRTIESKPKYGETIDVEVDTHVVGLLEFSNGVTGTLMMSFDVWDSQLPRLEIYGEKGSISISDIDPTDGPNIFEGPVYYKTKETARWNYRPRVSGLENWDVAENTHGYNKNSRGLGLIDMIYAIKNQRPHRASGEVAYHVLEIMEAIIKSGEQGEYLAINSTCPTPSPLPENFPLHEK